MKKKIVKVIKAILEVVVPMTIVSLVLWGISKKVEISLVWILSPYWMMLALFIAAFLLGLIKMPFTILFAYLELKNDKQDEIQIEEVPIDNVPFVENVPVQNVEVEIKNEHIIDSEGNVTKI